MISIRVVVDIRGLTFSAIALSASTFGRITAPFESMIRGFVPRLYSRCSSTDLSNIKSSAKEKWSFCTYSSAVFEQARYRSVSNGQDEYEVEADALLKPDVIYRVLSVYAFYISSAVGAYWHRLEPDRCGRSRVFRRMNNSLWICLYGA